MVLQQILHGYVYLAITMSLGLAGLTWMVVLQAVFVNMTNRLETHSALMLLIQYSLNLFPAVFSVIFGLLAAFGSMRRLLLLTAIPCIISVIVATAYPVPPSMAIALSFCGIWNSAFVVFLLTYITRATSITYRTWYFVLAYYIVNNMGSAMTAIYLKFCVPLGIPFAGGMFIGITMVTLVTALLLPERTSAFDDDKRWSAPCSELLNRIWHSRDTFLASLACLFLINASEFGVNLTYSEMTVLYGSLLVLFSVLSIIVVILLLRKVSDRALLAGAAVLMFVGYLIVVPTNTTDTCGIRCVIGSYVVLLADDAVVATSTSLLSKLIAPGTESIWLGFMLSTSATSSLLIHMYIPSYTIGVYIVSVCWMFSALLLQIPVYKYLLPQLFSPWSGGALPRPSEHRALFHSDDAASAGFTTVGSDVHFDANASAIAATAGRTMTGYGTSHIAASSGGTGAPTGRAQRGSMLLFVQQQPHRLDRTSVASKDSVAFVSRVLEKQAAYQTLD
eukprot:TRINITY_DN11909_c0_g1_i1.p1 TRINITY_DN11909_c0_g1~~TRINITY_DN11909_c0_g1_i1.p1  ORF type:complete len:505 (-),score=85.05 TRINITY_DN11909_c0_g1_i1:447-1961(-)